jgi:hypothetical protein
MLNHPLNHRSPCLELVALNQSVADSIENFTGRGFQFVPGVTLEISQFSFDRSKEEVVTRSRVWAIRWMGQALGLGCPRQSRGNPEL